MHGSTSQIGGGVSTRSSSKKVPRAPSEGIPDVSSSSASHGPIGSNVGHTPSFPQPQFGGWGLLHPGGLPVGDGDDNDYFRQSPSSPSPSPLSRGSNLPSAPPAITLQPVTGLSGHPSASATPSPSVGIKTSRQAEYAREGHVSVSSGVGDIHPRTEEPPRLLPFGMPGFGAHVPKDFDVLAAQAPADDEVVGARCAVSFDGEEEDFDASPSRQRAGRIPKDHKEIIDDGIRKIDAVISKMHEGTGRTSENLLNHYLASKGFKRVGSSVWNQYQRYFAAFRVEERIACGNPNAKCSEAFAHFQTRFTNWKDILGQVDELIAQEKACVSGYRRRTAFNQFKSKLDGIARVNHQTHGFEFFGVIMGNQPNTDHNLFFVIESPGAEGFMGDREENCPCAMYTSDFLGSFRAHINSEANRVHVEEFRAQQDEYDSSAQPQLPLRLEAGTLLNPNRKGKQIANKQPGIPTSSESLPPPPQPAKARSVSVLSTTSTSEGNDTYLRNVIRDFFHLRLKDVGVNISASAFPWKALDKTLVSQGGVILNYPDDVPFPNLSTDPTYHGPACKPEGRNGTGIRKIGIAAMRRLANRCTDDDDGIRFIGRFAKKLLEGSIIPWIVGPIPLDANSPVRCLFYDGSAKMVPRQLLPQEWLPSIKRELSPSPKASDKALIESRSTRGSPSPFRGQSPTPTPQSSEEALRMPPQSPSPRPISPETVALRLPSPMPQQSKLAIPPQPVVRENLSLPSSTPVPTFSNLRSYPRARIAGSRPIPLPTIEEPSSTDHDPPSSPRRDAPSPVLSPHTSTSSSIKTTAPKRALEDAEADSLSAKRHRSLTPKPLEVAAGPPALHEPVSSQHPPSPPDPFLPLGGTSPQTLRPAPIEPVHVKQPISLPQPSIPTAQDASVNRVDHQEGLHSSTAYAAPPSMPVEASQPTSDRASMQPSQPMYHGAYSPAYGGYPPYSHPYYPPPQAQPHWGYTDPRFNPYQREPQQEGAASGQTQASTTHPKPTNAYPFQPPDGMGAMYPHPPFYGRPDGAIYPPPFNPRFASVPPAAYEQYGQMAPPQLGMTPPRHSHIPPSGHTNMPPPSHTQMPPPAD